MASAEHDASVLFNHETKRWEGKVGSIVVYSGADQHDATIAVLGAATLLAKWEYPRAEIARLRSERDAARLELAHLLNTTLGRNTSEACSGEWEACWCDTCEARRKGA